MDTNLSSPNQADPEMPAKMLRYLMVLTAVVAVLYLVPFCVLRLPGYGVWSNTDNFLTSDFGFTAAGQNADIVIYGDSGEAHDFSPQQMGDALGLRVLILPSNSSLLAVAGDLPLRHYLKADKPPRLIILSFAPWDLDYGHSDLKTTPLYDGLEILVRHGAPADIYRFAMGHPSAIAEFPLMFYSVNIPSLLSSRQGSRKQAAQIRSTNGYTDFPHIGSYPMDCKIPDALLKRIHFDFARDMAKRLESSETKVLLFISPIPDCAGARAVTQLPYQQLPAAAPKIMPARLFGADQFYTHLYPEGVSAATESLTEAARAALASPQK